MRTQKDYDSMLEKNPIPITRIDIALAADMVFVARHGVINRSEDRGGAEWRHIERNLKLRYGGSLTLYQVRYEAVTCGSK